MVIYLYRWKLKPGKEEQFKAAWEIVTKGLRDHCHSRGSRLHLGNDGLYYGYAQWPNIETRESAYLDSPQIQDARAKMKDAIAESLPEVQLDPIADYLLLSEKK